ncbi:hypothetical protein ACFWZZ_16335, partial [[Kitasatospora] papulosa]
TTLGGGGSAHPAVRPAGGGAGLRVAPPAGAPAGGTDLDPFRRGRDLAGSAHGPLTVGARADLAVFDVPDEAALCAAGAAACVATVLGGRLVYRRR